MIRFIKKYWAIAGVGLAVLWIRLLLRVSRLPLVLDRLTVLTTTKNPDEMAMRDLVYYVDRWLQLFPYNAKGNCFPRSVAIYWFARRGGYPVHFHCGVRKESSKLDGHAWLTLDRQPFFEIGEHWQLFAVTFSYPPEAADRMQDLSGGHYGNKTAMS